MKCTARRLPMCAAATVSGLLLLSAAPALAQQADEQQQKEQKEQQQEAQQKQQEREQPEQESEQEREEPEQERRPAAGTSHTGTFIGSGEGQVTMTMNGQQSRHSHRVTSETRVTINGEPASLQELQRGDQIRVTMGEGNVARAIEATRRQQPEQQQPGAQRPQQQPGRAPAGRQQQATLGVRLGPSPTTGVFVQNVRPGSPAAQAGIQPGDYILSFNGEEIASQRELDQALSRIEAGEQARLVIWRDRQRQDVTVSFAGQREAQAQPGRRPAQPPAAGRGADDEVFLGVMLERSEQQGARITRVHPSGPAAQAGLQPGDILTAVDGQQVESPQQAAETISQLQPGQQAELVVLRNGQEQTMTTELARRSQVLGPAPLQRQDREAFGPGARPPMRGRPGPMRFQQEGRAAEQRQRIERLLRDLQQEVQQLRQEVQELKGQQPQQPGQPQQERRQPPPQEQGI